MMLKVGSYYEEDGTNVIHRVLIVDAPSNQVQIQRFFKDTNIHTYKFWCSIVIFKCRHLKELKYLKTPLWKTINE